MKKILGVITAGVMAVMMLAPATVGSAQTAAEAKDYIADEIIVKFKKGVSQNAMSALHKENEAYVKETSQYGGYQVVKVKGSVEKAVKEYNKSGYVEYAEPNYIYHATSYPVPTNDPYYSSQWGLHKIQAPQAWSHATGKNTVIAIIDTGVQVNHPDLAGKVINGYDFVDRDWTPQDGNGHGTHCAGIAAAITNNGRGIAGAAPDAQILAVRVLNNSGSGTLAAVADGIRYAADYGADVISLSLGGSSGATTLQQAVDYAWSKGAVVVAAAGNSGNTAPHYPAYYANAIAVASTDSNDNKSYFSTYGSWVDVAAPGSSIISTYPTSTYATLSGTSMATPYVAGVAALLKEQGRSNSQIRAAIQNSADRISDTGKYWKYGRVNALKAVQY